MKTVMLILTSYIAGYFCVLFGQNTVIIIQIIISGMLIGWFFSKLKTNQYATYLLLFLLFCTSLNYIYSLLLTKPPVKTEGFLIGLGILQLGIFFISFLIIKIDAYIKKKKISE